MDIFQKNPDINEPEKNTVNKLAKSRSEAIKNLNKTVKYILILNMSKIIQILTTANKSNKISQKLIKTVKNTIIINIVNKSVIFNRNATKIIQNVSKFCEN